MVHVLVILNLLQKYDSRQIYLINLIYNKILEYRKNRKFLLRNRIRKLTDQTFYQKYLKKLKWSYLSLLN
jgi:hypothetical protein